MVLNDLGVLARFFFIMKLKLRNKDKINTTPRASDPNIGINRRETRRMESLRLIEFSICLVLAMIFKAFVLSGRITTTRDDFF